MTEATYSLDLAKRVHDMVTAYVRQKTEDKSGIKTDFKGWPKKDVEGKLQTVVPEEYRQACEKICQDAFLTLRSCRSREDFVSYFVGTICAVRQFLPEDEYQRLGAALLAEGDTWEQVKALAMLTASASHV